MCQCVLVVLCYGAVKLYVCIYIIIDISFDRTIRDGTRKEGAQLALLLFVYRMSVCKINTVRTAVSVVELLHQSCIAVACVFDL